MNTTFKTWEEMMDHLKNVDHPQCFMVNYIPGTEEYEIWIGNQPYYNYEKLIEEAEEDSRKLSERVKQLLRDKEDMYRLVSRSGFKEVDRKEFERVYSS